MSFGSGANYIKGLRLQNSKFYLVLFTVDRNKKANNGVALNNPLKLSHLHLHRANVAYELTNPFNFSAQSEQPPWPVNAVWPLLLLLLPPHSYPHPHSETPPPPKPLAAQPSSKFAPRSPPNSRPMLTATAAAAAAERMKEPRERLNSISSSSP